MNHAIKNKHHKWESVINSRTKKQNPTGCPICSNQKICCDKGCNSVYISNPELRPEWDTQKNDSMKTYSFGSHNMNDHPYVIYLQYFLYGFIKIYTLPWCK